MSFFDDLWYRERPPYFDPTELRARVRGFLDLERGSGQFVARSDAWIAGHDPSFSKKLGERGWLGLTWPKQYGGSERSSIERYVVIEELLAAGAPVAAHWIAERQIGPALLRFGSQKQKSRFLPLIARGECYFSVGLSEPNAGSDLAAVSTQANRVPGGWIVNGRKMWTSHAQRSHYVVALCRSFSRGQSRYNGLSQFIIDLGAQGVSVQPITSMSGDAHFAEVTFESVFVPESMILGNEGEGWRQVNAELAYERSGPERFLSTFPLLSALCNESRVADVQSDDATIAMLVAELTTLRTMSISVAAQLDTGSAPAFEAAMVKDLGGAFENSVVDSSVKSQALRLSRKSSSVFPDLLRQSILAAPTFTLRGGTTEVLRGIIAKELSS